MNSRKSNLIVVLAVVAIGLSAVVTVMGQDGPARPSAVAVVELKRMLAGLDQRAAADVGLQKLREEYKTGKEQRETDIKARRDQLVNFLGDELATKEDEIREKVFEFQAWVQFEAERMDLERALLLQDLYLSIRKAAQEMADSERYDMVIIDDSTAELGANPEVRVSREAQILQQITARRLLYVNPVVDITEDLITRMNNAFQQGG